jgi:hypothetical protein
MRQKCNVCGKEFIIEFEDKGAGQTHMLPGTIPLRIRHCAGGNFVDVPCKLTAFSEIVDGKPVAVAPVVTDALED